MDDIYELIAQTFPEWDFEDDFAVFICPEDGNRIEPDGTCYCGQVSPLLQMGLI